MVQAEHHEQRKVGHHNIDSGDSGLSRLTKNGRCKRKDWKDKVRAWRLLYRELDVKGR